MCCVYFVHFNLKYTTVGLVIFLFVLKGSYDVAKNNIIWCNTMCLCGSWFIKHILHTLYIIVAHLCSTFLKRVDFYSDLNLICSDWPAIQCVVIGRIPQA